MASIVRIVRQFSVNQQIRALSGGATNPGTDIRKAWRFALVVVILFSSVLPGQADDPLAALAKAEETWAARRPKAYEFTLEIRCFCVLADHPVSFRVNGEESRILEDVDVQARRTYTYFSTVDKLFALLRRTATKKPSKMVVAYDARWGYPRQADLDGSRSARDDEVFFRVTSFGAVR